MMEDLGHCLGGSLNQGIILAIHLLKRLRHRRLFYKFYCGETM